MRNPLIHFLFAALALSLLSSPLHADSDVNQIFQYFQPCTEADRLNLGAYLWIPPNTPRIRAVMVGMHNGLPMNILQNSAVREVCRRHGIAQILMTPWAKEIGSVMLKDLKYDVTDPDRTAVYDSYLRRLAEVSGHPELVTAPIVPLAHSAFCDFPFDAAVRKPEQCLAAIPIKAGLPDVYNSYVAGSKAKSPNPNLCLRNVPILFVHSASQETVAWSRYPHGMSGPGMGSYRKDRDDNAGVDYEPRNELFGCCWDMMSGHFDMLPRNYRFVADWLDVIATQRLPKEAGQAMNNLTLRDGWLMHPQILPTGELPIDFPLPAPYLQYKGHRNQALWFPNEALARNQFELGRDEPRKKIEMFTFLDPSGQPISMAHGSMATMPNPTALLQGDGLFTLTTYHFTTPPEICTVKTKDHPTHPEEAHDLKNVLFPGTTTMPLSDLPLQFDPHGGGYELVKRETFKDARGVMETRFTLRLKRHRMNNTSGFNMSFVRVYHEGNIEFAAAGRTCQISLVPADAMKEAKTQKIDFPVIEDTPASAAKIALKATSSAGLPVDYFILKGPGIIQNGAFVPMEVPAQTKAPIEVTIGAYQVGLFQATGGVKPAETVYRTFRLIP